MPDCLTEVADMPTIGRFCPPTM